MAPEILIAQHTPASKVGTSDGIDAIAHDASLNGSRRSDVDSNPEIVALTLHRPANRLVDSPIKGGSASRSMAVRDQVDSRRLAPLSRETAAPRGSTINTSTITHPIDTAFEPSMHLLTDFNGGEYFRSSADRQSESLLGIDPPSQVAGTYWTNPGRLTIQYQGGDTSMRAATLAAAIDQPENRGIGNSKALSKDQDGPSTA